MKDIVGNRTNIDFGTKVRLAGLALRENGILWTVLIGIYYLASGLADRAYSVAAARRSALNLLGVNSPRMNKLIWNNWDWNSRGEEWSITQAWKDSVLTCLMGPNVPQGCDALEIGPGAGRWTEELVSRAGSLIAVDISETCVAECRQRFSHATHAQFLVGSGSDLSALGSASVDAIWSFDVFVHINKAEFAAYVGEFARVLRPGGRGVIQHGAVGGRSGGWRSDATAADVAEFLRAAGLVCVAQMTEWQDGPDRFPAGLYGDVVTVFHKAG